jgi:hypothetical protein
VSAGFEPSTHALKEQETSDLPRIFNNLQSPRAPQIGKQGPWSGLNRHANKHSSSERTRAAEPAAPRRLIYQCARAEAEVLPVVVPIVAIRSGVPN